MGAEVEELKNNGEFYNLDKPQMYINPDVCIDCGACITECPVDAIVTDNDKKVPNIKFWVDLNARLSSSWPNITKAKDPVPDAAEWKDKPNKIDLLEE